MLSLAVNARWERPNAGEARLHWIGLEPGRPGGVPLPGDRGASGVGSGERPALVDLPDRSAGSYRPGRVSEPGRGVHDASSAGEDPGDLPGGREVPGAFEDARQG